MTAQPLTSGLLLKARLQATVSLLPAQGSLHPWPLGKVSFKGTVQEGQIWHLY